jgi:hypothetical protein
VEGDLGAARLVRPGEAVPRGQSAENFGHGRIRFSDGTSVPFDLRSYTNPAVPLVVDLSAKDHIVWMEVVSDGGGGWWHTGLAEVEVFDTTTSTTANLLRPASATSQSASSQHSSPPRRDQGR